MTVAQFKRLMKDAKESGKPVQCRLFWIKKDTGDYYLQRDFGPRKVTIVQSNRYAMETQKLDLDGNPTGKMVDSWGDFPKAADLKDISPMCVEKYFVFGKIEFTFSA